MHQVKGPPRCVISSPLDFKNQIIVHKTLLYPRTECLQKGFLEVPRGKRRPCQASQRLQFEMLVGWPSSCSWRFHPSTLPPHQTPSLLVSSCQASSFVRLSSPPTFCSPFLAPGLPAQVGGGGRTPPNSSKLLLSSLGKKSEEHLCLLG